MLIVQVRKYILTNVFSCWTVGLHLADLLGGRVWINTQTI